MDMANVFDAGPIPLSGDALQQDAGRFTRQGGVCVLFQRGAARILTATQSVIFRAELQWQCAHSSSGSGPRCGCGQCHRAFLSSDSFTSRTGVVSVSHFDFERTKSECINVSILLCEKLRWKVNFLYIKIVLFDDFGFHPMNTPVNGVQSRKFHVDSVQIQVRLNQFLKETKLPRVVTPSETRQIR